MRFWLDLGVDALRLDAIPYLVERDGTNCENLPETHVVIKHLRGALDQEYEGRMLLAETNQIPADVCAYFGDGDECHMAFHFPLMPRLFMALRLEDRHPVTEVMAQTPAIPPNCQRGVFLRNHDELTLEMVSDDERAYMYLAYSADPRMRINVGIRRRLAPLVENNRPRLELLNSILFSMHGRRGTRRGVLRILYPDSAHSIHARAAGGMAARYDAEGIRRKELVEETHMRGDLTPTQPAGQRIAFTLWLPANRNSISRPPST